MCDIVEILIPGLPYNIEYVDGRRVFTHKDPVYEWIKASVIKRAKNGSVYVDYGDHYDASYSKRRWFKRGNWRESL